MHKLGQRLLKHTFANGAKLAVTLVSGFCLPPLVIHFLGLETFGAWALVFAIAQFVYIGDFGLQSALSKYVAERNAKRSYDEINSLVTMALGTYAGVSTFLMLVLFLVRERLVPLLFNANLDEMKSLGTLIFFVVLISLINLAGSLFLSILNGLQKMDVSSYISTFGATINFVVAVALMMLGFGLWALAIGYALSSLVTLIFGYFIARKFLPSLALNPAYLRSRSSWGLFRGVLALGSSDATNRVTGTIVGSGIRFLLGSFAGLGAVGYYDLASRFIAQLAMFPLIVSAPLVPAVAELNIQDGMGVVNNIVRKTLKYLNIFSLPFFAFSIIFAYPITIAWLGESYSPVAVGIQILAVGTYLNILTAPAYHSLIGMGKPRLGISFGLINLILNACVTIILIIKHGFLGAVIGQSISISVASIYFLFQFHRERMFPLFQTHWDTFCKPFLFLVVISIPMFQIYHSTVNMVHLNNVLGLITTYCIYTLLFFLILWHYKILDRHDFKMLTSMLRRV